MFSLIVDLTVILVEVSLQLAKYGIFLLGLVVLIILIA